MLKEQDPSGFPTVPPGFRDEVEKAAVEKRFGDLRLLANEASGFNWESEGLRVVGRAQFYNKDYKGAKNTWEALRQNLPLDPEATLLLGTIHDRLVELTESMQGVEHDRVLIFTGHMIDAPGRAKPRFPPGKEDVARQKIKEVVEAEMKADGGVSFGIAGAASGGDILFHEVCAELGIPTHLYLALPSGLYVKSSVQKAGPGWVERFRQIHERLSAKGSVRVLCELEDEPKDEKEYLPSWLRTKPNYNIWQRNNLWMLHNALATGDDDCVTLIALWDGESTGDGPGGTSDLVAKVEKRGAKAIIINTRKEFGL